jgi:hypothetical protein
LHTKNIGNAIAPKQWKKVPVNVDADFAQIPENPKTFGGEGQDFVNLAFHYEEGFSGSWTQRSM